LKGVAAVAGGRAAFLNDRGDVLWSRWQNTSRK
jgi:hypothetical protein